MKKQPNQSWFNSLSIVSNDVWFHALPSHRSSQNVRWGKIYPENNGLHSVFTELFEIGVNRKVLFFYGHNSEGSFVGARVVEKSTEKGVEKSRLQGFPIGPMENPIDYRFNGRFSTHHEMSLNSEVVSIERGINFTGRAELLRFKSHWFKKYDHF